MTSSRNKTPTKLPQLKKSGKHRLSRIALPIFVIGAVTISLFDYGALRNLGIIVSGSSVGKADRTMTITDSKIDFGRIAINKQVLLNQDDYKITAREIRDGKRGTEVKVLIENNSSENIAVYVKYLSVNGYKVKPIFFCDVIAGKKANDFIVILNSSLDELGINEIVELKLSFMFYDMESGDELYRTEISKIRTRLT